MFPMPIADAEYVVIFPTPPFASISKRKPAADEMLPLMDSNFFAAIIVVVVVLIEESLFMFFETAVTIIFLCIFTLDLVLWLGRLAIRGLFGLDE
jgi:hypothetical protein